MSMQYSDDGAPVLYTLGLDAQYVTSTGEASGIACFNPEGAGLWISSPSGATGSVLTGDTVLVSFADEDVNRLTTSGAFAAWSGSGIGWQFFIDANLTVGLEIPMGTTTLLVCTPNGGPFLVSSPDPNNPNYIGWGAGAAIQFQVAPFGGVG